MLRKVTQSDQFVSPMFVNGSVHLCVAWNEEELMSPKWGLSR